MDTDERQAKLTELARQLAEIQARPAGQPEQQRPEQQHPEQRRPGQQRPGQQRRGQEGPAVRTAPARHLPDLSSVSVGRRPDTESSTQDPSGPGDQRSRAHLEAAARGICLRLLSIAPRPRAGLAQALQRKDIPQDVATAVLDRFTELGLVDDVAYAQSFVRVKHRDRALGRAALRTELRKLGVDEDVMADAVQVVDTEAEQARAAALIDKRIDAAMAAGPVAARRRLLGLLDRRGYPAEVAVPVVESALQAYGGDAG